ncbi:Crp/Fnr family transcriptional regulator [Algoriphagus sp.]|uniref:Crp/Fnr family transcriptional regulator n=1 Tax=Algoriphagus sp. TaxID=1872435 RepID=UPI0025FA8C2F|nr:Crp/Fnr family transcriptional regulator [Algoriphagus sp.]
MQTIISNWESNQITFPKFKSYSKREIIYRQGEPSLGFYLVKHGSVKLQKTLPNGTQSILKIITSGEIFGDGTSIDSLNIRNNSLAIALEEGTLIQTISSKNFQDPTIGLQLLDKLQSYNLEMTQRVERLNWMDSESRIKHLLHHLAQKLGRRFGDETLLKLNLTHEEIAMLTDSSRQTVTKTLSNLKKDGVITYSRNRILFRNLSTFNSNS